MRGLIFKATVLEGNLHPRSTPRHVAEGASLEGVVVMALVRVVVVRQEYVVLVTRPTSQETNFLRAKSVERPTTSSSSVTSSLIPHIWVKRKMQLW
jgi:hypothetical protein